MQTSINRCYSARTRAWHARIPPAETCSQRTDTHGPHPIHCVLSFGRPRHELRAAAEQQMAGQNQRLCRRSRRLHVAARLQPLHRPDSRPLRLFCARGISPAVPSSPTNISPVPSDPLRLIGCSVDRSPDFVRVCHIPGTQHLALSSHFRSISSSRMSSRTRTPSSPSSRKVSSRNSTAVES